jgi:hypothetical protein
MARVELPHGINSVIASAWLQAMQVMQVMFQPQPP